MTPALHLELIFGISVVSGAIVYTTWKRHQKLVRMLRQEGIPVSARITKVTPVPEARQKANPYIPWWDFTYEFVSPNGKKVTHRMNCLEREDETIENLRPWLSGVSYASVEKVKEGESLKVLYHPDRPSLNYPESALPELSNGYTLDIDRGSVLFVSAVFLIVFSPLFIQLLP